MSSSSAGLPRAERATLVTGVGPDEMGVGSDMVRWMEAAAAAVAEDSEKFERPAPGARRGQLCVFYVLGSFATTLQGSSIHPSLHRARSP